MTARGHGAWLAAAWISAACSLAACDGGLPLKPQSGGDPYEVVLVTDNDTLRRLLDSALQTPMAGLPQAEGAFSVRHVDAATPTSPMRYARCLVVVQTGSAPSIKYERDAYARPQLAVYVSTPTAAALEKDVGKAAKPIARLISRFEERAAITALKRHASQEGAEAVAETTGWQMLIPEGLRAMKRERNFVWLSDNGSTAMLNICAYTYPGLDNSPGTVARMRDSVMRANIPGGKQGAFMRTAPGTTLYHTTLRRRTHTLTEVRGLWEMAGDAMGGPFVCHAACDSLRGRTVVAEAFVYAPGKPKRNLTRQLEAALATLRP